MLCGNLLPEVLASGLTMPMAPPGPMRVPAREDSDASGEDDLEQSFKLEMTSSSAAEAWRYDECAVRPTQPTTLAML